MTAAVHEEDLARLHLDLAGPDAVLCGPRGHALVPAALAASATHVLLGGERLARTRSDETVLAPSAADGVVGLRWPAPPPGTEPDPAHAVGLGRLRLVWSRRLMEETVAHLSARRTGSERLLDQQLVKGALADAAIGHWEAESGLRTDGRTADDLALLHCRITDTDRTLLRLLGTHGYTAAGPGSLAHLSELLADTYVKGC